MQRSRWNAIHYLHKQLNLCGTSQFGACPAVTAKSLHCNLGAKVSHKECSPLIINLTSQYEWDFSNHRQLNCFFRLKQWKHQNSNLFERNPYVTGGFPTKRVHNVQLLPRLWRHPFVIQSQVCFTWWRHQIPSTKASDAEFWWVFLSSPWINGWIWWFEMPSRLLWRHCNVLYLSVVSIITTTVVKISAIKLMTRGPYVPVGWTVSLLYKWNSNKHNTFKVGCKKSVLIATPRG